MVSTSQRKLDWPNLLARHDLVWNEAPTEWHEGPFMGNGTMGSMLYYDTKVSAYHLHINSAEVQDHRRPIKMSGVDNSRLPVGHFLMRTKGKVIETKLRLDLFHASTNGAITTDSGVIQIYLSVDANQNLVIIRTECSGNEVVEWEFVGEEAFSPRQTYAFTTNNPNRIAKDYPPNPPGRRDRQRSCETWTQPLLAGGGTVTAWRTFDQYLCGTIAYDRKELPSSKAISVLEHLQSSDIVRIRSDHEDWWAKYFQASFISIPDAKMESFYWIQIYKLACATRSNGIVVDDNGPWLQPTPWPYMTWNLNVQLTYWPAIASNHADLVESLTNAIYDNRQELIDNCEEQYRHDSSTLLRTSGSDLHSPANAPWKDAPTGQLSGLQSGMGVNPPEVGNLPWALHDCWLAYRHTMNADLLRNKIYPILVRTTNYYLHFVFKGEDGKLHLPVTYSPEYGSAKDLTYNLALLRWSCSTLQVAAKTLGRELDKRWQDVLDNLVDYPQDPKQGWLIGKEFPLSSSHRHYSHLLQAYPLYLVNRDQGQDAVDLIRRTLFHWQSMPEALQGYSCTGGSSIAAAVGDGDLGLKYLKGLFDDFLCANTMYRESGPVIETPLSGAQSILDMLLQSWGGVVRPFSAMPKEWPEATFCDLSAEGGFLVSAHWENHQTKWIRIESKAGESLLLETDIVEPEFTIGECSDGVKKDSQGFLVIPLSKGECCIITQKGWSGSIQACPLAFPVSEHNQFGSKQHRQLAPRIL